jgi:hypothetical protein
LTAVLAFDWITWKNPAEFEAAFDKLQRLIAKQIAAIERVGRNFRYTPADKSRGEGYWNASHPTNTTCFYLEAFLALDVYGINPSGPSHAWAGKIIDKMGLDPSFDSTAVFSPWHMANTLNLISLGNGGGREWGAYDAGPSFGGYEVPFGLSSVFVLHALDTATRSRWNLFAKNLYVQTRHIGLDAIDDTVVEKTAFHPDARSVVEAWARLLGNTEAGRRYSYISTRSPNYAYFGRMPLLLALAGVKPPPQGPSGAFAGRVGSRFYYKENLANPDGTFRLYTHLRSLDNHREIGNERVLGFAIGKVGLVSGHANRAAPVGVLANGLWFGPKSPAGDPIFAQEGWWATEFTQDLYHSPNRASMPDVVATDPMYLVGKQAKPVFSSGRYSWSVDWTAWATNLGTEDYVNSTVTSYELTPSEKKLVIVDEISIDLSDGLYLGWHFSPNIVPVPIPNGFEFGDGKDKIRVLVESLGSFGLKRVIKTGEKPFNLGNYLLDLEWHLTGNGGRLKRIAANVGFRPDRLVRSQLYRVRVTIQANPR